MPEITFTDQNFETEVLKSDLPVLVDFWAEWCAPCRAQGPIIEELAREFEGKVKIGKLDVDANSATAQKYNIMSIPTIVIFKNGQIVWQGVGLQSKARLVSELNKVVEK